MGNKAERKSDNKKVLNYRWYQTTTYVKKNKQTDLIWEPFPIDLSIKIEEQYNTSSYYEKGNSVFLFSHSHHNSAQNLLINKTNVWEQKEIMRTDNIDNVKVYRKERKQKLNIEKTIVFDQFALALSQQMAYGYYSNIFKYTNYNTNDQFVTQFVNYATLLDLNFYGYLQKNYEEFLTSCHGLNDELFSFNSIKNILKSDFSKEKELEQYISIFIDNLTKENFFLTIIAMFNEEGMLYKKIVKLQTNKAFEVNTAYIMYYLCLLFTLNTLNSAKKTKTIYFDTLLCSSELEIQLNNDYFNKDDIFYLPEMIIASKEEINQRIQIEIFTQQETNIYPFLQFNSYDVSDYSLYHEKDVIIRPGSAVRFLGIRKRESATILQFELIEDIICQQISFLSQNEKKNYSIFDDISTINNDESTTVAYAKVRQRKINYLKSRLCLCQALNFYDNEIGDEGIEIVASCFQRMKKLKWLNFTGNEIGEVGLLKFTLYTSNLRYLTYINFSFNLITDKALEAICFADLQSLKYLILKENQITYVGMIYLASQLCYLKELIELDLYNNHIEDKGVIALSNQFRILKDLQKLDLYNIWCTDESMMYFFKEWTHLESLSYLNLKQNSFGKSKQVNALLLATIISMKKLTYLNISQNNIQSSIMSDIIHLLENSRHQLTFVEQTCEFIASNNQLLYLNCVNQNTISSQAISKNNFKMIINHEDNTRKFKQPLKLKSINQTSVRITHDNFEAFRINAHKYTSLEILSFEDCPISIQMAKQFPSIYKPLSFILELNLSFCQLTNQSITSIFHKIHILANLKTLNLNSNYIGEQGIELLSPNFKKLSQLETLDLSWNSINTKGLVYFSQHLSYLVHLRFLELYGNNINDEGMKYVCETLISLNKLESLNLGKNQISSKSIKLLCKCFSRLISLTDLNLYDNIIGNNGIKVFFQYFNNVVQLKTFDLRNNCLSEKMKQYVSDQGIPRGFKLD